MFLNIQLLRDQTVAVNEKAMECAISARNHFPNKKVAIAGSLSLIFSSRYCRWN